MGVGISQIAELEGKISSALSAVKVKEDLELLKRDWLGKEGVIKTLFKELKEVSPEEKPKVAALLNSAKEKLEAFVEPVMREGGD